MLALSEEMKEFNNNQLFFQKVDYLSVKNINHYDKLLKYYCSLIQKKEQSIQNCQIKSNKPIYNRKQFLSKMYFIREVKREKKTLDELKNVIENLTMFIEYRKTWLSNRFDNALKSKYNIIPDKQKQMLIKFFATKMSYGTFSTEDYFPIILRELINSYKNFTPEDYDLSEEDDLSEDEIWDECCYRIIYNLNRDINYYVK